MPGFKLDGSSHSGIKHMDSEPNLYSVKTSYRKIIAKL